MLHFSLHVFQDCLPHAMGHVESWTEADLASKQIWLIKQYSEFENEQTCM